MRVMNRDARPWIAYAPALSIGSPLATYHAMSASESSTMCTTVRSTRAECARRPSRAADARQDLMGAARQAPQHRRGVRRVGGLAQHLAARHDGRIARGMHVPGAPDDHGG